MGQCILTIPTSRVSVPQSPPKQGSVIKFNINLYQSEPWPGAPIRAHAGTLDLLTLLGLGFSGQILSSTVLPAPTSLASQTTKVITKAGQGSRGISSSFSPLPNPWVVVSKHMVQNLHSRAHPHPCVTAHSSRLTPTAQPVSRDEGLSQQRHLQDASISPPPPPASGDTVRWSSTGVQIWLVQSESH